MTKTPTAVAVAHKWHAAGMSGTTRTATSGRKLGRTGPVVGAVALGCSAMSGPAGAGADDEVAARTIRAAVDQGIDLIDTADFYGLGHNEALIAHALGGVPRDRYLLSDRFGGLRDPSGAFVGTDCRPATLKAFLGYSLQRLKTDHVDIYRPARLDPAVTEEQALGARSAVRGRHSLRVRMQHPRGRLGGQASVGNVNG